jgi:hypothetical protein
MTLRRYTVTLRRSQEQVVEFTADDGDLRSSGMQLLVADGYAAPDLWKDYETRIVSLSSVVIPHARTG